jgi:arginine/lysine/ornithine decarboxylase
VKLTKPINLKSLQGSKRWKENEPLSDVLPSLNQAGPPSKKRKTVRDKLDAIFLVIKKEELTLGRIQVFGILL